MEDHIICFSLENADVVLFYVCRSHIVDLCFYPSLSGQICDQSYLRPQLYYKGFLRMDRTDRTDLWVLGREHVNLFHENLRNPVCGR